MFFIRTSPVLVFHAHTCSTHCMLAYSLHACILIMHTHCMLAYLHACITLAYFDTCILCTWMLSLFHLHWGTYSVHVVVQVWKCQCVSVSVEVSVFKGFFRKNPSQCFRAKTLGKPKNQKNKTKNLGKSWGKGGFQPRVSENYLFVLFLLFSFLVFPRFFRFS